MHAVTAISKMLPGCSVKSVFIAIKKSRAHTLEHKLVPVKVKRGFRKKQIRRPARVGVPRPAVYSSSLVATSFFSSLGRNLNETAH